MSRRGFPPRSEIWFPGGATLGSANVSTNHVIAKPGTVVDNTLLLAFMAASANVAFSVASTGFQATLGGGTGGGFAAFWKWIPVASAESASSYTFTYGLANARGFIIPVLGCDPSGPIEEIVRGTPASGTPTSPSIDPDQTGLTLVSAMQMITGGSTMPTAPSGMTSWFTDATNNAKRGAAAEVLGPDDATTTRAWGSSTGNYGSASVLLKPAA